MKKFSLKVLALVLPMILFGFTGKAMASDMIVKKAAVTNLVEKKAMNKIMPSMFRIKFGWSGCKFACTGSGDCCTVKVTIDINIDVSNIVIPPGFNPPADALIALMATHDDIAFNGVPYEVEIGEQYYPAGDDRVEPTQQTGYRFPAQNSYYSDQLGGQLLYYYED